MSNSDKISGEIITFYDGICVFKTKYGANIKLMSKDILNVETDNKYEIVLESGERIIGKLTLGGSNKSFIESEQFGKVPVNCNSIISLKKVVDPEVAAQDKKETFGKEKEKAPPLDFLTGSTVLLNPGQMELELGLRYKQSRTAYSMMNVGYFDRAAYTARMFEASLTFRAGIMDRLEGWVTVPGTYATIEDVSTNEFVRNTNSFDLGDISFGGQYLLFKETDNLPAISATLGITAPTGQKTYYAISSVWKDALNNGNGHWAFSPGLSFVRTLDPAMLFGGIACQYSLTDKINGYEVTPGFGVSGYLGLGFALNEKLSVGSRVSYGYYSEMEVDNVKIAGSDSEPIDLSFSASYRAFEDWVVTPEVTFGLNDDAGAANLSLRLTRSF
ncbi:transporter [Desulfovibrio gilichinskyi]|nr:transporter [Desulfovibrio gilichinskyi]